MDVDEEIIAEVFKSAGYQTAAYGKWHNGMQAPFHPNSRGFDDYYGFCSGHWGNYYNPLLEHNGNLVRGDGFIIDDLTQHGIDFIKKNISNGGYIIIDDCHNLDLNGKTILLAIKENFRINNNLFLIDTYGYSGMVYRYIETN